MRSQFILVSFVLFGSLLACERRDYGGSSFVCVCNASYCDFFKDNFNFGKNQYLTVTTDEENMRNEVNTYDFSRYTLCSDLIFKVNAQTTYQTINGFGGSFTDATGINLLNLSKPAQNNFMLSHFGRKGIDYVLGRVPMGSTDFSVRKYTYADEPDETISNFALAEEDFKYKLRIKPTFIGFALIVEKWFIVCDAVHSNAMIAVHESERKDYFHNGLRNKLVQLASQPVLTFYQSIPFIQEAVRLSEEKLKLITTAWLTPAWMKDINNSLKREYFLLWAQYFYRFLEEYDKQGIKFWAITPGNEPNLGFFYQLGIEFTYWTPQQQGLWIGKYAGPLLEKSKYSSLKIFTLDDMRSSLPWWAFSVFKEKDAQKYAAGIAVHWYSDSSVPLDVLQWTHHMFPVKELIYTEACHMKPKNESSAIRLGSWERAEAYALSIIEVMKHWVTTWIDWNLALNLEGGPNRIQNFVDAPIIVNGSADEFYKQPMFYVMGHFSKFVRPGSKKIELKGDSEEVQAIAFRTPEHKMVVEILNTCDSARIVCIQGCPNGSASLKVPRKSITTFICKLR